MRPKHEYARYCIIYCRPQIVNESSTEIINKIDTHSFEGFSKYIKIKILESYNENCTTQNCYICNRNLETLCMFVIYPQVSYTHTHTHTHTHIHTHTHTHTQCMNICLW